MLTKLELSTNLLGLDGLYCTYHGLGRDLIDSYQIDQDFKEGYIQYNSNYYWSNYDNSAFMDDWAKDVYNHVSDIIQDTFKHILGLDITLEYQGRWSPREYNFAHDIVNLDINCDAGFEKLINYCKNNSKFPKFLKDNYTSYDGFMSHTSNRVDLLLEDAETDDMTAFGAMVRFLLSQECDEDDFTYIEFETYYSEYFTGQEALDAVIEELKSGSTEELEWGMNSVDKEMREFLIQEYLSLNREEVLELYNMEFEEAVTILVARHPDMVEDVIRAFVAKYFNEIDSKTLSLFAAEII